MNNLYSTSVEKSMSLNIILPAATVLGIKFNFIGAELRGAIGPLSDLEARNEAAVLTFSSGFIAGNSSTSLMLF